MYTGNMISLGSIFTGLVMVALGVLGLRYTFQLVNLTGSQDWIESKLGSGSTFGTYKIFALLLVAIGILETLGLMTGIMNWLLTPLRGLFPQA
jgi:hypothetical protein